MATSAPMTGRNVGATSGCDRPGRAAAPAQMLTRRTRVSRSTVVSDSPERSSTVRIRRMDGAVMNTIRPSCRARPGRQGRQHLVGHAVQQPRGHRHVDQHGVGHRDDGDDREQGAGVVVGQADVHRLEQRPGRRGEHVQRRDHGLGDADQQVDDAGGDDAGEQGRQEGPDRDVGPPRPCSPGRRADEGVEAVAAPAPSATVRAPNPCP